MKQDCSSVFIVIAKDTNNISYLQSGMVLEEKLCCVEFDLHADICNLGSGSLATYFMNFLKGPGTQGQNMRPNRLSYMTGFKILYVHVFISLSLMMV